MTTPAQTPVSATVANGAATSVTATLGSTPTVGNKLVLLAMSRTGFSHTTPTGFTADVLNFDYSVGKMSVFTRTVQSGDGASYTVSTGNTSGAKILWVIELPATVGATDKIGTGTAAANDTTATASGANTSATSFVIGFVAGRAINSWSAMVTGYTLSSTAQVDTAASAAGSAWGYKDVTSVETSTATATVADTNNHGLILITFPVTAGGPTPFIGWGIPL